MCIMKSWLYNFDLLKPHFYIVKLGFLGVYIIFLISAQNIDCGYSLEPSRLIKQNTHMISLIRAFAYPISTSVETIIEYIGAAKSRILIHLCRMDSSKAAFWTGLFPIEGVSGRFLLLPYCIAIPVVHANSADTDQTPCSAESDLDNVPFMGHWA